jgi:hypothetical protein
MKPLNELPDDDFEHLLRRAIALPDAPLAQVRAAIDLWPAQPALQPSIVRGLLSQVSAILSFDSWNIAPLAAGMRSLRSPTRHLLFNAGARDIDLRVTPAGQAFTLTGQVLGPEETGQVELAQIPGDGLRLAALDALGEFRLEGIGAGSYRLTLHLGGDEIVLPALGVGPPSE